MGLQRNAIGVAFPTLWNIFLRLKRRLKRIATLTDTSKAKAIERLTSLFEKEGGEIGATDDEYELIEAIVALVFDIPRSDAELVYLFGLTDEEPTESATRQKQLLLVSGNLRCPSTWWYHDLQEALAARRFSQMPDTPYPAVSFRHKSAHGRAELRPRIIDDAATLSPELENKWIADMWAQREKMDDRDADTLDAMSATWLKSAGDSDHDVLIKPEDVLRMRGISPKISGQGRRGGYRPDQRRR